MRLSRWNRLLCLCGLPAFALVAMMVGCATKPPATDAPPAAADLTGLLRATDHIKIDLTGVPETIEPLETEIKEDGTVNIPLIGRVEAAGKTPGQLEKDIQALLVPKYYAHCNVTVTPTGRYFYIGGEINPSSTGGRIPLSGPITVTRAIATGGGFSPFANKRKVLVTRVNGKKITVNCRRAVTHPEEDVPIYPGDSIYIPRRF